eukprot:COSAG02_NODE_232_length_27935_cov_16.544511_11_plen_105_part_00
MVVGEKRYLLLPPTACSDLSLLPYGHPSARHSNITLSQVAAYAAAEASRNQPVHRLATKSRTGTDASDSTQAHTGNANLDRYLAAQALDVHLSPGDVLHLPAYA